MTVPDPDGSAPARVDVAVVVVTYNSAALIKDFLAALPDGLDGVRWHLIVVDNASRDGSEDLVRALAPESTIVQTGRNAGYAAGINAGVAAAPEHTAVLVLNPDVRLRPGCVAELLRTVRLPGTGIAVPRLVDGAGGLIPSQRREPSVVRTLAEVVLGGRLAGRIGSLGEVVTDEARYQRETVTDWAEGSTQLISSACWRRCDGWDESFFLYSEETDFALRARDLGLVTRYAPTAGAVHLEGEGRYHPQLWTMMTLNRLRLYRRRHGAVPAGAMWVALVLREARRAALGHDTSRAALSALFTPRRLRTPPSAADLLPPSAERPGVNASA